MKKIILTSAACLAVFFGLNAQSNTQSDSVHIHVIKNVNGNIQEIDTAVAASQQENLFQWMSTQGIEVENIPADGSKPRIIQVEVQEIMMDSTDGSQMRIPAPPTSPDAPQMRVIMMAPPCPPVPPAPGEKMEKMVIINGDSTKTITRKHETIIIYDESETRTPAPPSPPSPPASPEKKAPADKAELMTVYPNPTSGNITLSFEIPGTGKTIITVSDMNGKLVYEEQLGEAFTGRYTKEINLGSTKGTYTVQVKKGNSILVKKVLVQ